MRGLKLTLTLALAVCCVFGAAHAGEPDQASSVREAVLRGQFHDAGTLGKVLEGMDAARLRRLVVSIAGELRAREASLLQSPTNAIIASDAERMELLQGLRTPTAALTRVDFMPLSLRPEELSPGIRAAFKSSEQRTAIIKKALVRDLLSRVGLTPDAFGSRATPLLIRLGQTARIRLGVTLPVVSGTFAATGAADVDRLLVDGVFDGTRLDITSQVLGKAVVLKVRGTLTSVAGPTTIGDAAPGEIPVHEYESRLLTINSSVTVASGGYLLIGYPAPGPVADGSRVVRLLLCRVRVATLSRKPGRNPERSIVELEYKDD